MCVLACALWLGGAGAATQPERRQLFYIGLALYSEPWSVNDVVELAVALRRNSDFDVVPLIASNVLTSPRRYPVATSETMANLMHAAAESARPDDVVLVHISTHGGPGVLASRIGRRPPTVITAAALARLLAPLGERRTVLIVSACYSGSLIGTLRAPNRIVMTAARADRSSFGCAADSRHTFFGEAELYGFDERDRSLHQVFTAIREDVARMERRDGDTPSDPQVSVGAGVAGLYEARLF